MLHTRCLTVCGPYNNLFFKLIKSIFGNYLITRVHNKKIFFIHLFYTKTF